MQGREFNLHFCSGFSLLTFASSACPPIPSQEFVSPLFSGFSLPKAVCCPKLSNHHGWCLGFLQRSRRSSTAACERTHVGPMWVAVSACPHTLTVTWGSPHSRQAGALAIPPESFPPLQISRVLEAGAMSQVGSRWDICIALYVVEGSLPRRWKWVSRSIFCGRLVPVPVPAL